MNRRTFLKAFALTVGGLALSRFPKSNNDLPDDIVVILEGERPYTIHWCTTEDFRQDKIPKWHPMTQEQWEKFNEKRCLERERWRKSRLLQYGWD